MWIRSRVTFLSGRSNADQRSRCPLKKATRERIHIARLHSPEVRVQRLVCQQFIVGATFCDTAVFENDDLVGILEVESR